MKFVKIIPEAAGWYWVFYQTKTASAWSVVEVLGGPDQLVRTPKGIWAESDMKKFDVVRFFGPIHPPVDLCKSILEQKEDIPSATNCPLCGDYAPVKDADPVEEMFQCSTCQHEFPFSAVEHLTQHAIPLP